MKLQRKHAVLFLAIAVWNWLSYARFTKALIETEEDRATSYYVAHSVLIVVNVVIGVVLAILGVKAWKGAKSST